MLGFAGVDNHGLAGLELQLDKTLSGSPGKETIVKDPFGRAIDVVSQTPEREGRNVFLTIDHTIQANAELVLRQTVHQWGAKSATAIVLDPHTGAVLAMAVQPGYDANRFASVPPRMQENHAVLDVYEPGSTFKLVTVAGVLSDRLVSPSTAFTLPYSIRVADRTVHDAEKRGTERLTVAQILAHSSNVGAITLAREARQGAARVVDHEVRLRQPDRDRLPGREPGDRAPGRPVVGLDDRQRPDRPGHRRDADPDGVASTARWRTTASGCSRIWSTTSRAA